MVVQNAGFPFKSFVGLFGEGNNIQNIELINI